MCNCNTKEYELQLPIKLADDLDHLSCCLKISKGEVVARALQLLYHAVRADKILLTKNSKTKEVIIK